MNCTALVRVLQVNRNQIFLRLARFRSTTNLKQEADQHGKSTVDKHDVRHFVEMANSWWDEMGILKPLHSLNKLRVPLIRDGLLNVGQIDLTQWQSSQPLHGLKILDVGCGGGILTEALARIGASVTGIDAGQSIIDAACSHACKDPSVSDSITYICGTVEEHANKHKEFYDVVVASEILEHVFHPDLFVGACVSLLKPGGSIFITTLNRTCLMWAFGIIMAEYVLRVMPQGTHELEKCVKPHETEAFLEKYGCTTKLVHGMLYNFLSNEWYWSSNTSLNYGLQAVKRQQ